MSMVKSVELLLKMEVSDDIRAAIMTAIISPRKPVIHTHAQIHAGTTKGQLSSFNHLGSLFESSVLTAWHEFNDQFGKGNVGASHFSSAHSHTLFWIHTSYRVWNMKQSQVIHPQL